MLNVIAYSLHARIRNSILNPYTFINSFTFTELKSRLSKETHTWCTCVPYVGRVQECVCVYVMDVIEVKAFLECLSISKRFHMA